MAEKLTGELEMLENEEKIAQLATRGAELHLTNKRLAYTGVLPRTRETSTAMIRDVDSATMQRRRASLAWIIVGVILIIIGFAIGQQYYTREYAWIPMLIGAILIGLFFLLRKSIVQFTIGGTSWLTLPTRKLGSKSKVTEFVNKFFEAKDRVYKI